MSKQDKYSRGEDMDDLEGLSDRLAADLRKNIRALGNHAIFSDAWCDMAETCGRIAKVTDMESKVAAAKDDATLWETEEQALRYLLEDGKMNLCLRQLLQYKAHQRAQALTGESAIPAHIAAGDAFEKGIGSTLRNAWSHVEAVQTTDLPALVTHITDVLDFATIHPEVVLTPYVRAGDLHQRQEVVVFVYLVGLAKALVHIDESRLMPEIRDKKVFSLGAKVALLLHDLDATGGSSVSGSAATASGKYMFPHVLCALEALSMLCDTEDFATYTRQHVDMAAVDAEDVQNLLRIQAIVQAEYSGDSATRTKLRPLMDAIGRVKRQAGRK